MNRTAFVFPGQGCQYTGMGKYFIDNYAVAKEVFKEAGEILKIDMLRLCMEGPDAELSKTENTQPAILTTSIAILRVLEQKGFKCDMTAGLSLGEYAALVKAHVMSFHDAVQIVKLRGKLMQETVPLGVGTMAAIIGMKDENIPECLEYGKVHGIVEIANYNCPGQIVVSGQVEAVRSAMDKAKDMGARSVIELSVSAPFHSSLLTSAGEKLEEELMKLSLNNPQIPVIANASAQPIINKEQVIPSLAMQVSSSVRWQESVELMIARGVTRFIEIGPGDTLIRLITKIAKKNHSTVEIYNTDDAESFQALCDAGADL